MTISAGTKNTIYRREVTFSLPQLNEDLYLDISVFALRGLFITLSICLKMPKNKGVEIKKIPSLN